MVYGVGVEVIRVTADALPRMAKEKGMESLVDEGWQLDKWILNYLWNSKNSIGFLINQDDTCQEDDYQIHSNYEK